MSTEFAALTTLLFTVVFASAITLAIQALGVPDAVPDEYHGPLGLLVGVVSLVAGQALVSILDD